MAKTDFDIEIDLLQVICEGSHVLLKDRTGDQEENDKKHRNYLGMVKEQKERVLEAALREPQALKDRTAKVQEMVDKAADKDEKQ